MKSSIRRFAYPVAGFSIVALVGLLALSVVDPGNRLLKDTATVAPWASGLAAITLAALTALYVAATEEMAEATSQLAQETRTTREASSRPIVIAEMEADQHHVAWLVIRSIGNEVAREFRISCVPDMAIMNGKQTLMSLALFNRGLPMLGPGSYIRTMLDFFPNITANNSALQFTIRLSYKDAQGNKLGPFEFPIDFGAYKDLRPGQSELMRIAAALEAIQQKLP